MQRRVGEQRRTGQQRRVCGHQRRAEHRAAATGRLLLLLLLWVVMRRHGHRRLGRIHGTVMLLLRHAVHWGGRVLVMVLRRCVTVMRQRRADRLLVRIDVIIAGAASCASGASVAAAAVGAIMMLRRTGVAKAKQKWNWFRIGLGKAVAGRCIAQLNSDFEILLRMCNVGTTVTQLRRRRPPVDDAG